MTTPITASLDVNLSALEGKLATAQRAIQANDARQTRLFARLRQHESRIGVFDKAVNALEKKSRGVGKQITKGVVGGFVAGELSEFGEETGGFAGGLAGAAVGGAIFGGGLPGAIAFVGLSLFTQVISELKNQIKDYRREVRETLRDYKKDREKILEEVRDREYRIEKELKQESIRLADELRVETADLMLETSKYVGWGSEN